MDAVGLFDSAAGAVTHHGLAQLDPHRQAQAAVAQVVLPAVDGQARIHRALSPSVQAAEHVIEFQRNGVLHACRLLDFSVCYAGAVGKLPRPF